MRVRIRVCVAVLVGLLGLMLVSGFAQEKKKAYTKGDTVKVRYVGEVVTGKVVSAKISGFIDVEFDWKGKKIVKTFPLTLVEVGATPAAATTPAPAPKPAPGTPKPAAGSKRPAPSRLRNRQNRRPRPRHRTRLPRPATKSRSCGSGRAKRGRLRSRRVSWGWRTGRSSC